MAGRASEDAPGAAGGIGGVGAAGVDDELGDSDRDAPARVDPVADIVADVAALVDPAPADPVLVDPAASVDPSVGVVLVVDATARWGALGANGTDAWAAPAIGGGTVFPDRPGGGGGGFLRSTGASVGPVGSGATTEVDVDDGAVAGGVSDEEAPAGAADPADAGGVVADGVRVGPVAGGAFVDDAVRVGPVAGGAFVDDAVRVAPLPGAFVDDVGPLPGAFVDDVGPLPGAFVDDGVRVGPLAGGALVVGAARPGVVRGASGSGVWPSSVRIATGRSACAARTPMIRPTTSPAAPSTWASIGWGRR